MTVGIIGLLKRSSRSERRSARNRRSTGSRGRSRRALFEPLETRNLLATITVTGDGDTTNDADGVTTLREAILAANSTPGADTIDFQIPGTNVHTISPTSALPELLDTITIDGTTDPDYAGVPLIEIDGSLAGAGVDGLRVVDDNSTIRGLNINRFVGNGIVLDNVEGTTIELNYIGTDPTGSLDFGNRRNGLYVVEALDPTADGPVIGAGNLISNNVISGNGTDTSPADGVQVWGATNTQVVGNYIGINAAGTASVPNSRDGLHFFESAANTIGGATPEDRNVISGNVADGVDISGALSTGNSVIGNYIGTAADGVGSVGNQDGIELGQDAADNTIGGTVAGEGNLISGNRSDGVELFSGTTNNSVVGNKIGTTVDGTAALSNGNNGIQLTTTANTNTIGGTADGAGNLISGNRSDGIELWGAGVVDNSVLGNTIGTDPTGAFAIPNRNNGVLVGNSASNNTIGGVTVAARNLVSGNAVNGIQLHGTNTSDNQVLGNYFGTDAAGSVAIPNGGDGVNITAGASSNVVGGTDAQGFNHVIVFKRRS